LIARDEQVVCIATGHGLKDPDIIIKSSRKPVEIDASPDHVLQALDAQRKPFKTPSISS